VRGLWEGQRILWREYPGAAIAFAFSLLGAVVGDLVTVWGFIGVAYACVFFAELRRIRLAVEARPAECEWCGRRHG